MTGLIRYSDLMELPLNNAATTIRTANRIRYGDIKLSDLLLIGTVADLKLSDYSSPSYYGIGVYVFFDGNIPVYVGEADNFLHHLSSHRSTKPRAGWGWNALLQAICRNKLNIGADVQENLEKALEIAESFGVVRVLLDSDDVQQKLSRFERIVMKGIKCQSNTLWNRRIGKVKDNFIQQPLKNLMQ